MTFPDLQNYQTYNCFDVGFNYFPQKTRTPSVLAQGFPKTVSSLTRAEYVRQPSAVSNQPPFYYRLRVTMASVPASELSKEQQGRRGQRAEHDEPHQGCRLQRRGLLADADDQDDDYDGDIDDDE